jgi:pyruvate,water dikinase
METGKEIILQLNSISRKEIDLVGAKAANLGELARAGFLVPEGFVLTTTAFDIFLDANQLSLCSTSKKVTSATLPAEIHTPLLNAALQLGQAPLAVRSSGVAEDLSGASFAGQYETVLNVHGANALITAVKRCWASVFSERVVAYSKSKGMLTPPRMALLIQRMIVPDAAGVAFSANPVTGDLAEVVVSAVRGLGERLVSGQASPDEWVIKDGKAVVRASPEGAINAEKVQEIAELAKQAETHFGSPQDIEWAISSNSLYLLQSRPITTLPGKDTMMSPVLLEVPPGFWEREGSHYSQPVSPITRSSYLPAQVAGFAYMCKQLQLPFEKNDYREIGGWVYQHPVPLGGKDRKPPPSWLMFLLIRILPEMRSRVKGMSSLIRNDVSGSMIEKWYNEWKPQQTKRIAELHAIKLSGLSDENLYDHLTAVTEFLNESHKIHGLMMGIELANSLLTFTCRDLFGWDEKRTVRLLSGLSSTTSLPSLRLTELSQMVKQRPKLLQLLESGNEKQIFTQLDRIAPDFAEAFASYQHDFGCRAVAFDVALPTVLEMPTLTINLILNQVRRGYDPQADADVLSQERDSALREAEELLTKCSSKERERFKADLNRAQRAFPIREDHEFYLTQAPLALLRYAAIEIGSRFVKRGYLSERDDVFWLEIPEIKNTLQNGGDKRPLVQRRKAERNWVEAHPGPAYYGKPTKPPSASLFPGDARIMMEGMLWIMESQQALEKSARSQKSGDVLRGIAASSGSYTGKVRVILNEGQFSKIQAGDVLVCPTTSPVWSMLFPSIGGLVTDSGGILSHPAIIAREYRVPAVVATHNATQMLCDGQIVTVDGTAGTVQLHTK